MRLDALDHSFWVEDQEIAGGRERDTSASAIPCLITGIIEKKLGARRSK
jgi:hypothetical protein